MSVRRAARKVPKTYAGQGVPPASMIDDHGGALSRTSVIIPTLNEAASIGQVLDQIPKGVLEVLIVDGASRDATRGIAEGKGARVISEPRKGYGRAYRTGFAAARGDFIATLDGDLTYPAETIGDLVQVLVEKDLDFITGDRLAHLNKAAMSTSHRVGNWILSTAARVLFRVPIHDSQSGMWVLRREILKDLTVTADGMALSEELKIEAFRARPARCKEIPIDYRVRVGEPVLASWKDGWANVRFLFGKRFGRAVGVKGDLYGPAG